MNVTLGKALFALALAVYPAAAMAGDIASLNVIGFSRDGQLFAFEEFGVQDGSGFPYSNIFVVDLEKDEFAEGTPVRTRIDDEAVSLATVRKMAFDKIAGVIARDGIDDDPGSMLVFNPVSEAGSNPARVDFHDYASVLSPGRTYRLDLGEVELPVPEGCKDIVERGVGFRLSMTGLEPASEPMIVHEDMSLPESRNCVESYRIAAVIASRSDLSTRVAVVQVNSFGFEGQDGRFIAVPLARAAKP